MLEYEQLTKGVNFIMEHENKFDNKIGLVPLLYEEYNYGGVLQLYALQYTIRKLGYEVDIIELVQRAKQALI